MTDSLRRIIHPREIPQSRPNFPERSPWEKAPRRLSHPLSGCAPGLFISQHAFFYHGSMSFVVHSPGTWRDETRTGTNLRDNVSRACARLPDPAALITLHEIFTESALPLSFSRSCRLPLSRAKGPPAEEIASPTCILRAAILMDTRCSMLTKGCWF